MSSQQDTQDTPRRRRSPAVAASVAAAVLLLGGGGAYWAASAGGGAGSPAASGGTPPPLVLDGRTDTGSGGVGPRGAEPSETGGPAGIAPGEPDPHGGAGGRVVYRAAGELPGGPDAAAVYRAQGAVGADEVRRLAKALGVTGTPRLVGGSWQAGTLEDGSGPQLRVSERAPGTWTFARHARGREGVGCAPGEQCTPGGPVDEETAKKAAAPVLRASGIEDAELDARQVLGGARVVNADPVVDGLPTYGWTTGIPVGPDGRVAGGSGRLKGLTKGAEYPVVGAGEALRMLNRGGALPDIGGCATPVPVEKDGAGARDGGQVEPVAPERDPGQGRTAPCEPREAPRRTVTVGSAVFGLSAQYADGQQMLVPSWLFQVRPAGDERPYTVTYPAVEPRFLTAPEPPAGAPSAEPSRDPSATPDLHVESYRADGRKLSLTFWGGVCSTYAAEAAEDGGVVKVRIVERDPDPERVCIALAKKLAVTATLEEPLGGRGVVGGDGKPVPRG